MVVSPGTLQNQSMGLLTSISTKQKNTYVKTQTKRCNTCLHRLNGSNLYAGKPQKPSSLHECSLAPGVWSVRGQSPRQCEAYRVVSWDWLRLGWVSGVRQATPPTFLRKFHLVHSGRPEQRSPPQFSWLWADQMNQLAGCRLPSGCLCTSSCPCSWLWKNMNSGKAVSGNHLFQIKARFSRAF